ncbi:MAG TPA: NAD-glutamate dehydrogenase [Rhizomicrobium sp.]|nr:NAD-glutamate dehydrogenase [Rhizomicrobium sp.]
MAKPDNSELARQRLEEARAIAAKQNDAALAAFFDALFGGVDADDILMWDAAALAKIAAGAKGVLDLHDFGQIDVKLLPGPSPAEPEDMLVAINDDRPFLFDSALRAAGAAGARIRAAFHPIVTYEGTATSVIVLMLDVVGNRDGLVTFMLRAFGQGILAVRDWKDMLARLKETREELAAHPPKGGDVSEDLAFLDWLADNHFTFLGARDYRLEAEGGEYRLEPLDITGLGALADAGERVLRRPSDPRTRQSRILPREVLDFLNEPQVLIVTKSSTMSLVHRRVHMDYVGVKTFDAKGAFSGEHRFVGLFTSGAYSLSPGQIPLLRRKIAAVAKRASLSPTSHDGKALAHILDTYPRDELFQISEDELYATAMGILRLGGRPKVRLFLRFDRFDRFVTALLFAPRDHIDGAARTRIHALLAKALNGRTSASDMAIDESGLVRVHYIMGRNPGPRPKADIGALEHDITETLKTWDDAFVEAMSARHGRSEGARLAAARDAKFSPGYQSQFPAHDAVRDLEVLEKLSISNDPVKVSASVWRREGDAAPVIRLKLHVVGEILPLSATLPVFENLGLNAVAEDNFPLTFKRDDGWTAEAVILDFLMERADGQPARLDDIREPLEVAFRAVIRGQVESDNLNRLVMGAGLDWRDITILRAVAKFLRQAAIPFSQDYMEQALNRNPDIAALLVELFAARNHPIDASDAAAGKAAERIEAALRDVPSLDDDRILRRFRNVIENILRTNFWQEGGARPALAFKLDSQKLDELPAPRPWREIFVYSPVMEGVHLRFGKVARGGIRWSDRREDFRTEILGLVKAQQVKNAVIVPVGAKGGFFPKIMPVGGTREEIMAMGVAAYKMLINALLDVTDNLKPDGGIVPPADVKRHDGDDPYLVVAADKGTATFSDIANGIAESRGFWLGDAFASGGSHGYDHKKMGITARGAWEAVKRHFRELSRDIQKEDFTVIGVGDMSGDVFGNGMLLSEHIRLLAGFDHRHIFLDPSAPTGADDGAPFKERQRLFALPRSSWDDYDKSLIGKGGGVFARSLKEILLTPEVQALIGSDAKSLSPPALINALLKAKTDLLWFGGIGTYIKASSQNNLDVGDRANDALRVNGRDVRALVVGEGANLGVTQLGRIEYARAGGRIDTDAVDNSAGVDTSDHEVNLKILLSGPNRRGEIDARKRDALLAAMTDDVAALVLADNYDQTLALSVAEASGPRDIDADARFIRELESRSKLDRAVEFLPGDSEIATLAHDGKGLTRPELAVLIAYAKLDLDAEILASPLPDDPALMPSLAAYFPPAAVAGFAAELPQHRLKREIISTGLANRIVNLAGPVLVARMKEMSGSSGAEVARAFVVAEGAFGLEALKKRIDGLDGKLPAPEQTALYVEIAEILRRLGLWFVAHVNAKDDLAASIALYRAGVEALRGQYKDFISTEQAEEVAARIGRFKKAPPELARDIGLLPILGVAPEIALLAQTGGHDILCVAKLYFGVGGLIGLDRLRLLAARITPAEHWDRLAIRRLVDDLFAAQRALAQNLLANMPKTAGAADAAGALDDWAEKNADALERTRNFLAALESSGELSIAKLTLANSQVHKLAEV